LRMGGRITKHANVPEESVREGKVKVTGGQVWYRMVGASRKKIPLLVLNGGPGVPHDYLEPLEALADERPVVFFDPLGCGDSDKPKKKSLWTLERFADEITQVRNTLGLKKVHILGHSYGTTLGLEYMLEVKPRGVASLILSSPILSVRLFLSDAKRNISRMPKCERRLLQESMGAGRFINKKAKKAYEIYWQRHLCGLDRLPDYAKRAFKKAGGQVYKHMWGDEEIFVTGTLKNFERESRLREIRVPVLFTAGQHDECSPRTTAHFKNLIPGSEIAILRNTRHLHVFEKPEEYVRIVRAFLNRVESR